MRRSGSTSQTNKQNAGRGGCQSLCVRRFFFVHFPAFRTLFLGEQDNFIHLPADHAEKPLISVDFYRPKCVDLTFGDFLTIIILKQGDYLVVEKVKT